MKKYLKRIVFLFALLLSIVANAYDFEVNSIYYNSNGSNATVTHKGSPYTSNSYSGNVVIPEEVLYDSVLYTVSAIDAVAFWYCNALKSVDIPNTVTCIGSSAFWGCTNLSSIKIPKSVISIPTTIGVSSSSLENPFAVESIKSIQVENGNPKYDSRNNCNAIIETETNILISGCQNSVIPNSVTIIGGSSFSYSRFLKNIEIPNSVTTIGIDAFRECYGLTHLVIPNSVTTIWDRAFYDCRNLKSVEIPTSVTKFDGYLTALPFYMCNNISTIMISGEGEWLAGRIPISMSTSNTQLYIDSQITSVKNMDAGPAEVYCYAPNPPDAEGAFYYYTGTLHVPQASLAAYFTAPYWSNFSNIVGDAVEPSDVILNHESIEINSGEQLTLTAQILPVNAFPNDITWTSTNPNVVDVHDGILSAISPGECDIIARCLYKKAICHVIVNDTTVTISLDQHEIMLLPNHMLTLTPSATPFLPELVVTSSDPSVAAARVMNDKVQVVGIKEGMTVITVGSADGTARPATCLVTVYTELGDVNCDGYVDIADITQLINYLLDPNEELLSKKNADIIQDGAIDITDATTLINYLLTDSWPWQEDPSNPEPQNETFTVNGVSFTMVAVEGGSFTMGASDDDADAYDNEKPSHQVTLSSYFIGETEVTQELWLAVMGSNPSAYTGDLNRPVEQVSWNDCQMFINKLNDLTGMTFRLPTEAEWEFAARGGNLSQGYKYSGSNNLNAVAWYDGNANHTTHLVATKAPNELGIYDMTGNVTEWCQDWFGDYSSAAQTNPAGPETGTRKVERSSCFTLYVKDMRIPYRMSNPPTAKMWNQGVRIAL